MASGTSDSAGTTFTAAQTTTSFDSADRKVVQTLSASGTTYRLTQYGYDALSRLDRAATRMNSTVWTSLPVFGLHGASDRDRRA